MCSTVLAVQYTGHNMGDRNRGFLLLFGLGGGREGGGEAERYAVGDVRNCIHDNQLDGISWEPGDV